MKLRNIGNRTMFITIPICLMTSRKKGTEKNKEWYYFNIVGEFFIMKNMNSK